MSPIEKSPDLAASDRYRSFKGIDFDGQAQRMMARIESHTRQGSDPFWTYFYKRRHATEGARCDALGLAWLDQLENECF